ncbi:MAG TPA: AAA family ATPase, partial [Aquella sp.]|nr:AAA family ATPase [Aquella sp.]
MNHKKTSIIFTNDPSDSDPSDSNISTESDYDKPKPKSKKRSRNDSDKSSSNKKRKVIPKKKSSDSDQNYDPTDTHWYRSDILEDYEPQLSNLNKSDKNYYSHKIISLNTPTQKIPTILEILDMQIDIRQKKSLIEDINELQRYYPIEPIYDELADRIIRKVEFYKNQNISELVPSLREIEAKLIAKPKFTQPLLHRILLSQMSDDIKAILYDKYKSYCCETQSHTEDSAKYKNWIETVLSLPMTTKAISLPEGEGEGEADGVGQLLQNLLTQFDEKIYGMSEVKEELLCMLLGTISNPKSKFKAIGICGPPGVGKTMIARIIAEVLDLPIEQISLGGITDSSFLEGHGFTYIGSEHGCITKAIIKMGYTNGIIYLDEIDKISKTH